MPYVMLPDESRYVDQQSWKLQECPEAVPTGEMPRSVVLCAERNLVDVAPPGTRITVVGIASLFHNLPGAGSKGSGVKTIYLRVVGLARNSNATNAIQFTPREEESFHRLSKHPNLYHILSSSVAPSISGSYTVDIKKSLMCQLFGGSLKRLPDRMRLRGDIHVLLMGDPSTAKSQFLKFIERVAPIGVYTSGKGSSAAGLTASVIRDKSGEFYLEGGAMVLADGGCVCIDEFDKMRAEDRVAIHEAMEQQTISVAKAGITTVLNSRTSVLAAANPVYGRYDDLKSAGENIDLMSTILSRFDMVFLVRDVRDEGRDSMICKHVMGVHMNSNRDFASGAMAAKATMVTAEDMVNDALTAGNINTSSTSNSHTPAGEADPDSVAEDAARVAVMGGELQIATMKKYIQYARKTCSPRLSEDAGEVLTSSYVKIRDGVRRSNLESGGSPAIPITVRQLEALIRISESLAKMRLSNDVHGQDITEALRLFQVSTMAANNHGNTTPGSSSTGMGATPLTSAPSPEEITRAELFLRSRLVVGNPLVNKQRVLEESAALGYNALVVARACCVMVAKGEIQERNSGRLIKRIL